MANKGAARTGTTSSTLAELTAGVYTKDGIAVQFEKQNDDRHVVVLPDGRRKDLLSIAEVLPSNGVNIFVEGDPELGAGGTRPGVWIDPNAVVPVLMNESVNIDAVGENGQQGFTITSPGKFSKNNTYAIGVVSGVPDSQLVYVVGVEAVNTDTLHAVLTNNSDAAIEGGIKVVNVFLVGEGVGTLAVTLDAPAVGATEVTGTTSEPGAEVVITG